MLISPFEGRLTSGWGWREILGRPLTFHRGQDIAPPIPGTRGLPVYAPVDMDIIYVTEGTYSKAEGKWLGNGYTGTWNTGPLVIARGRGRWAAWWFLFGHLESITVKTGQRVKVGHVLGKAGDKGNVQGVHLHFEVWTSSIQGGGYAQGNTVDPFDFYRQHGVRLGSAPDLTKTPTSPFPQEDIVASIAELDTLLGQRLAAQNAQLHTAIQDDITRLVDDIVRKRDNVQNTALHNMVRRELALAIGNAPGVDIDTLAPRLAGLLVDDVRDAVAESIAEAPGRDAAEVADAVVTKIANRLTQED